MDINGTTYVDPASIQITSIQPTLVSVTHSLKRQARSRGGQRWMIEIDFPPLSRADFSPLYGFALVQKGQYGTFTIQPPIYKDAQGTASSCLASAASAGSETVTVTMAGSLLVGDYVKFASHDKVYMVTTDLSGNGSLSIQPSLLEDVSASSTVTYDNVPFTVAFAADIQEFSRGAADLHKFSMSLVEVV